MTTLRLLRLPLALALALLIGAGAPAPVAAQELEQVLERVAAAWHKGDASSISAAGARAGISLDIDGSSVGPLGPR
ncbi:MAG TPA: hypothetical protein VLC53_14965, partial [Myxococcota bacterium]|nr:hypothetical protein [Myxococcota bacterium]